jgi:membrane protein implicated in regulation of membrane protease activity
MPQLIFLAVVGAVAYAGYKKFVGEAEKLTARSKRQEQEARAGSQGTLIRDPKTGVYTVAKD